MKIVFLLFFLCFYNLLISQSKEDIKLGQEYYIQGEFDKALVYYKKIYRKNDSKVYFTRYLDCLIKTNNSKSAEKLLL